MAKGRQTRGKCTFCEREMTGVGFARHLAACPGRQEAIEAASQKPRKEQMLYHLQVRDAWQGLYWLHLEMNGSATLARLDGYLRVIWLECCGHMSQFSVGGWSGATISTRRRAEQVFEVGMALTHIYDFGTSSETLVKVVGMREGKPLTSHPIALMARNDPPEFRCMECEKPASWLCIECVYEYEKAGMLCEEHVVDHPHEDYGDPLPVVNSPRLGMCGYDGPAEPPY